jgi:hypothetical protein
MNYFLPHLTNLLGRLDRGMVVGPVGPSRRTPPPEDLPRAVSPEPAEHEESTDFPWCLREGPGEFSVSTEPLCAYSKQASRHWLFAEDIQERLCEECIPFHVRGLPVSSPHAMIEGSTAKTVPVARQKIEAQPNEVVVSVFQRGKPTQISLKPVHLVPWPPSKGNKVLIIRHHQIGQVGKLVKLEDGRCVVELAASGANSLFDELDVVNLLQK